MGKKNIYVIDGGKAYHQSVNGGLGDYGYNLVARRRAKKIARYIRKDCTVLEYGVGPGWNLARIDAQEKVGYDAAVAVQDLVERQGIQFINELENGHLNHFDLVLCSHVLEHIESPLDSVEKLLSCLNESGSAIIYLPLDIGRKFRKYDPNDPNHHIYSWNIQSFINLLDTRGIKVKLWSVKRFGYERFVARICEKIKLPFWTYQFILSGLLFFFPDYEMEFVIEKP